MHLPGAPSPDDLLRARAVQSTCGTDNSVRIFEAEVLATAAATGTPSGVDRLTSAALSLPLLSPANTSSPRIAPACFLPILLPPPDVLALDKSHFVSVLIQQGPCANPSLPNCASDLCPAAGDGCSGGAQAGGTAGMTAAMDAVMQSCCVGQVRAPDPAATSACIIAAG